MKNGLKLLLCTAMVAVLPLSATALQQPEKHPGYIHALSDLRAARVLLAPPSGDTTVTEDEKVAMHEVDGAIAEIKRAAIDDGKNINDHPGVDVKEHGSRLAMAMETLNQAQQDILGEEDTPQARDLRGRALGYIERAYKAADNAHSRWLKDVQHH